MAKDKEKADEAAAVTLTVTREMHTQLKVIAAHREVTLGSALETYGGPGIVREYRKVLAEMSAEVAPVTVGGEGG